MKFVVTQPLCGAGLALLEGQADVFITNKRNVEFRNGL
jgi:hypothetical protein